MNKSESYTPIQRFWKLLEQDKREVQNVYIYAVFSGLISLSLPLGVQAIINLIQGGRVSTAWIVLMIFVLIGVLLTGVMQIQQLKITEGLQQKVFTRAAFELAYRLPKMKMEAIYTRYAPEMMNRFFDIVTVQKGLSKLLIDFSTAILHILFGLVLLSFYHPFFIALGIILILFVYIIFRLTGAKGLATSIKESKHKYSVVHWLEELARTISSFKSAGETNLHLENTDERVGHYLTSRNSHFKVLVQQYSLMVIFKLVIVGSLLALGGFLVMQQQMNIGQFVAAEIVILLIMGAVEKLILNLETVYDVLTSLEKVGEITDLELEGKTGVNVLDTCTDRGMSVELEGLNFSYPGNPQKGLSNISLTAKSGEVVVITGELGAGKSTLMQILAGTYGIDEGVIQFGGIGLAQLDLDKLRLITGDCLQHEQIFEGTIRENITMGRPEISEKQLQKTLQDLLLTDFIKNQKMGLETVLSPKGGVLPSSILQKILLSRSTVHQPKLLLLENVVPQLTKNKAQKITDHLLSKQNGWTTIAVTSDPYFLQKADKILIMQEGTVIDTLSADQPDFKEKIQAKLFKKGHA